jgi:phosphoglycolate phosphatase-like HAD superfamily hydrolase
VTARTVNKVSTLLKDIKRFGLEKLVSAAVGGDELANHKPHPDHMYLAAQRAGVAVSAADAMVGDSPADYEIAKAAGTYAYLLHRQVHDFAELIKNNPKASVVSRPLLHKTLFQG